MAEPSARSPVVLTLTPSPAASRVVARLFTGSGPGEYLLFSTFSFQLPSELSAAKATAVEVMARVARASLNRRCIRVLLVGVGIMEMKPRMTEGAFQMADGGRGPSRKRSQCT